MRTGRLWLYAHNVDFANSESGTIGIEWELQLVDPASRALVGCAEQFVSALGDQRVKSEFFTNTIELVTGVHQGVDAAVGELRELRDAVLAQADAQGLALVGMGIHPTAHWRDQQVSRDARYERLIAKASTWGQRQIILGVHTHIGVDDRETAIALQRALVGHLPLILALSASSPFWHGTDAGFDSQRTMLFQQLPNAGIPPAFASWSEYEHAVDELLACGAVESVNELRWDVRPSPAFGTIEVRIADGATSLAEVAAVSALTAALAEESRRSSASGTSPAQLPEWLLRENRWRAARYGLDSEIVAGDRSTVSVRDAVADAIRRLTPLANEIGAADSLAEVPRILTAGNAASRQRRAAETGGMPAVVDMLIDDLRR